MLGKIDGFGGVFEDYQPRPARLFVPTRIVLARGSTTTPERAAFVRRVCAVYPDAEVVEEGDVSHARVEVPGRTLLERHRVGKHVLVFGEHGDAVRFSEERGNCCPNYWHFSPYGFCPYNCHYCYLAGTTGVKFSPSVKIFVNLPEILGRIDRIATQLAKPTPFFLGKLQDPLALEPLTGYARVIVPFFASHPHARLTLLTKSTEVGNLVGLEHNGNTILSWSLSPPAIAKEFEPDTPSIEERLAAMEKCVAAGYPVRANLMPLIPADGWKDLYEDFIAHLTQRVPLARLTMGGVCSYKTARSLMNGKLGEGTSSTRRCRPPTGSPPTAASAIPKTCARRCIRT